MNLCLLVFGLVCSRVVSMGLGARLISLTAIIHKIALRHFLEMYFIANIFLQLEMKSSLHELPKALTRLLAP